eukprot:1869617-Amphidinium_carterae.1
MFVAGGRAGLRPSGNTYPIAVADLEIRFKSKPLHECTKVAHSPVHIRKHVGYAIPRKVEPLVLR